MTGIVKIIDQKNMSSFEDDPELKRLHQKAIGASYKARPGSSGRAGKIDFTTPLETPAMEYETYKSAEGLQGIHIENKHEIELTNNRPVTIGVFRSDNEEYAIGQIVELMPPIKIPIHGRIIHIQKTGEGRFRVTLELCTPIQSEEGDSPFVKKLIDLMNEQNIGLDQAVAVIMAIDKDKPYSADEIQDARKDLKARLEKIIKP